MKYLSENQVLSLQNKSSVNQDHYILIKVLLNTGLRIHELCKMIVQDINFDARYIHIKGKGQKIRTIDIDTETTNLLRLYIKQKSLTMKDRIFPYSRQAYHKTLKTYDESISAHQFRHTYSINVMRKTGNLRFLQRQLGHANLNTTAKYLQFIEYDKEKKLLEELYK